MIKRAIFFLFFLFLGTLAPAQVIFNPDLNVAIPDLNPPRVPIASLPDIILFAPDLIVTDITPVGDPYLNNDSVVVPVRITLKNVGSAAAGAFKVSVDAIEEGAGAYGYHVGFVPVGGGGPYGVVDGLAAGASTTLTGRLMFSSHTRQVYATLRALVDSCSGEEFTPTYCHVSELSESNNSATSAQIWLP